MSDGQRSHEARIYPCSSVLVQRLVGACVWHRVLCITFNTCSRGEQWTYQADSDDLIIFLSFFPYTVFAMPGIILYYVLLIDLSRIATRCPHMCVDA